MPAGIDETGKTFGRLTVARRNGSIDGCIAWQCVCICGEQVTVRSRTLRNGNTKSCGCLSSELTSARNYKHGGTVRGQPRSAEYRCWQSMVRRCRDPEEESWKYYGGRGIRVFDGWVQDFAAFVEHIGPRPTPAHSVDRIDPDGNYEPGNVRWATPTEQSRNKRNNTLLNYRGRTITLAEAAEFSPASRGAVSWRLRNGWSAEAAIETPPHAQN